jgi:hypothetical protein
MSLNSRRSGGAYLLNLSNDLVARYHRSECIGKIPHPDVMIGATYATHQELCNKVTLVHMLWVRNLDGLHLHGFDGYSRFDNPRHGSDNASIWIK